MTASVGLLAVLANIGVLLVLAAALASPRPSQLARLIIATFAFVCAWLITSAFDAMHAPSSTVFMGAAVIVVSVVVVVVALHRWTRVGDDGQTHPRPRDDDGGGGPRRRSPGAPRPGGGGSDPRWWPEFERQFASYAAERERENRQVRT